MPSTKIFVSLGFLLVMGSPCVGRCFFPTCQLPNSWHRDVILITTAWPRAQLTLTFMLRIFLTYVLPCGLWLITSLSICPASLVATWHLLWLHSFFSHYSPCLTVPPVTPAFLLDKQYLLNLSRWQVFKVHKRIIPQQPIVDIYLSVINTYFVIFSTDFETVLIHNILCSII